MNYCEVAREIVSAGLYEAAVMLMDDELREELHYDLVGSANDSKEFFLALYMRRHYEKYGIDFII